MKRSKTMVLTEKQRVQFEEAARPLMKFLGDNFHPHVKAIVDYYDAEFLESSVLFKTEDYIKD